ncbi:hypothetical protein, partial [uncultured Caballeronia sp.]|uniref:hypothetical protein n=1 Tax=uncultured Caballeronia sp. TaxID=1827198 RepID=UPI0035CAA4DB
MVSFFNVEFRRSERFPLLTASLFLFSITSASSPTVHSLSHANQFRTTASMKSCLKQTHLTPRSTGTLYRRHPQAM